MRLAFMGTPEFSAPTLSELVAAGHDVAMVYTREPRPSGRGKVLKKSPVHRLAEDLGLPIRTPKTFRHVDEISFFRSLNLDVAIVVAYGLILPQDALDAPRYGCLNLHASLLPRWRGAAPIHRAIIAGDTMTGIQVMQMEAGLDTGPILLSETVQIGPDDTAGTLHDKLSRIGAQLAPRSLAALARGALQSTPQNDKGVTYAEKISPAEAEIDWTAPAAMVDRRIRGMSPFPGAWIVAQTGERIKILFSALADGEGSPGEILSIDDGIVIACGDGAVALHTLQRPGKKPQPANVFLRGLAISPGECL
ncbi:MAG: methionyl-tRNA formyltransferase [Pseudomonadota bacterium]